MIMVVPDLAIAERVGKGQEARQARSGEPLELVPGEGGRPWSSSRDGELVYQGSLACPGSSGRFPEGIGDQ